MEITFLGTSSMCPTKERNHSAIFLKYKSHGILIDCGEGTQRQIKIAGIKIPDVTKILITHWHGDHVLGLPGLIQTRSMTETPTPMEIYGPKGIKKHIKNAFETFDVRPTFQINITEVGTGEFFKNEDFSMHALPLKHNIPCVGYTFNEADKRRINIENVKKTGIPEGPLLGDLQQGKTISWKGKKITPEQTTYLVKGKKITFIIDTGLTQNCFKLAENADILVCEATYASKLEEKATERNHLTSLEAAQIASKANTKKLILTHFSQRYKNTQEIEEDARNAFDNVVCAKDFMRTIV
ncbi:ribonuclease Z [Candidatus Woesearchaeota archaeon]|nr:ribonuclease Z [Candidatus Woesearchaeota archaeon]